MTLFGWDASSYDGLITPAIAQRAKSEGIVFATHRLVRQNGAIDTNAGASLSGFKTAGIEFIGAYTVSHSGDGKAQADATITAANLNCPWWSTFPGWFWQVDLEKWPTDPVPASVGIACANELAAKTGKRVIVYASHGQYGDSLSALTHPLWNANYVSSSNAPFKSLYPGDNGVGWHPYSLQVPVMWQYASTATIAGLTTCDANAFRGTVEDLSNLIIIKKEGTFMTLGPQAEADLIFGVLNILNGTDPTQRGDKSPNKLHEKLDKILNAVTGTTLAISPDQLQQIAADIASAVVAHHDALSDGDLTGIQEKVHAELQKLTVNVTP
jgi:hypothetical protein